MKKLVHKTDRAKRARLMNCTKGDLCSAKMITNRVYDKIVEACFLEDNYNSDTLHNLLITINEVGNLINLMIPDLDKLHDELMKASDERRRQEKER